MVKISRLDDAFLEVFLTASKPSRRPITAAKRKEKEKKERPKENFKNRKKNEKCPRFQDSVFIVVPSIKQKEVLRRPGIEPGSTAWKAAMLTTIPPTL